MTAAPANVISVEEARERILRLVSRLGTEARPLEDVLGQVLASDAHSPIALPPVDNTAMDGYAVRAADTVGAEEDAPCSLRVIGEVAAGYVFDGEVTAGTAVRIMTGAPIPIGADAIVPFEETDEEELQAQGTSARGRSQIAILKSAKRGANVRYAGESIRKHDLLLSAGTELRSGHIGVLASVGQGEVLVHRRPVVALISTGDELTRLDAALTPGKIYDSNAYSVAAQVQEFGGIPLMLGIASDTLRALGDKLDRALEADFVVTTGGVSRGDYDVVKHFLMREGEIDMWTVNMRPGKPLAFGTFSKNGRLLPHLGLPGNPVSAMVAFELFGRPAIFKMMGRTHWERPELRVTLKQKLVGSQGPRHYIRAIVTESDAGLEAIATGPQGSGILTSMAHANALVICPEGIDTMEAGEQATAMLLGPVEKASKSIVNG